MVHWHLVTGEYPPQPGGVSDYTQLLARGLAQAGDRVDVWAPACAGQSPGLPGIMVHRLPGHFGPRGLARLGAALERSSVGARVLVQYVPHMYGWKAMNLAFCSWLLLRCPVAPWVIFHEVAFPCAWGQRLRHNFLGAVTRLMAALVARAAERIFVSTPAWTELLRRLAPGRRPAEWLPIPSTVATGTDPTAVAVLRQQLVGNGRQVIGHFGSFGGMNSDLLAAVLPPLLVADEGRVALLIGRGSIAFAEQLAGRHPALAGRLRACGEVTAEMAGTHLQSCDLLVQPYPDGVSTRRTSLMGGLALGVPAVTTQGFATESVWSEEGLVSLAPADDTAALVGAAERLLTDPQARRELGHRARAGYARHFSIENTVQALRGVPEPHRHGTAGVVQRR